MGVKVDHGADGTVAANVDDMSAAVVANVFVILIVKRLSRISLCFALLLLKAKIKKYSYLFFC